jgi:hypothetical protein
MVTVTLDRSMQIRQDIYKALCVYQHVYQDLKKENISANATQIFQKTINIFLSA